MKRNKTNCRHAKAFPTIIAQLAGVLWCPTCGAIRSIEVVPGTNAFKNSSRNWTYPTGYKDVLRQIEQRKLP